VNGQRRGPPQHAAPDQIIIGAIPPDADRLAIRACLQARREWPLLDGIALEIPYGELQQRGEMLLGERPTAPKAASAWKIWRPGQPPIERNEKNIETQ
jgi:hypothetical protein